MIQVHPKRIGVHSCHTKSIDKPHQLFGLHLIMIRNISQQLIEPINIVECFLIVGCYCRLFTMVRGQCGTEIIVQLLSEWLFWCCWFFMHENPFHQFLFWPTWETHELLPFQAVVIKTKLISYCNEVYFACKLPSILLVCGCAIHFPLLLCFCYYLSGIMVNIRKLMKKKVNAYYLL